MTRLQQCLLGAVFLTAAMMPLAAQTVAITGGTVYTGTGQRLPGATVLFRDGRILEVGTAVAIPAGAVRVDAAGKWIAPGFIHVGANAGLGVRGLSGLGETSQSGDVTASFNVSAGIDPNAIDIPLTRTGGVTSGLLMPNGNFIAGQAVFVDFAGARVEDMMVRSPAGLRINLSSSARGAGGNSRAGALARLRQILLDAREFASRREDYRKAQIQPLAAPAADLEALLPVLRGEVPVLFTANRQDDIENAMRVAQEFRLRAVIYGGVEAWKVASALAAARIPVAINPMQDIPSFDGLGARLDNATLLRAAGVEVLFAHQDPGGERNLRFGAGNAVRNGMSWDDALRAVTAAPAAVFGLADRGSVEAGRVANLVIWSGDPFEFSSAAEKVYIRGVETSLRSRETELLERYRTLPPRY